ncbi:hypothetical protein OAM36_02185 [Candidatus Pelagibacter sp.]|nr:hypothetical protein [Candidatus Pelagibacter sp.]
MKKEIYENELNLSEIILIILKNKLKIFIITFITVVSVLIIYQFQYKNINKIVFLAETDVVANSIFKDYEYQALNSFIDSLKKKNLSAFNNKEILMGKEEDNNITLVPDGFRNYNIFSNLSFETINRLYLFKLFDEKLNQKDFFIKAIIKYNLVDKKKFNNNNEYELAVFKLAASIEIIREVENENNLTTKLKFKTSDKANWEKFLYSIEKSANEEIRNYLKKKFELLISNINTISFYYLEDIEFEISSNKENEQILLGLNNIKRRIQDNRNINRMIDFFSETPIIRSDQFTAANIKIQSTKYQDITKYPASIEKIIFISIFLGVLLGIIHVLIQNMLQNRR